MDWYSSHINYWAHVGGYLAGIALAHATGLFRAGLREGLLTRGTALDPHGDGGAADRSLESLLRLDPDNVEALLSAARRDTAYAVRPEARENYRRAIGLLLRWDGKRAAGIFCEYFRKYGDTLPVQEQLLLARHLCSLGEYDLAARSLELSASDPQCDAFHRGRALLSQASILVQMGLREAAASLYETFLRDQPEAEAAAIARTRLAQLRAAGTGRV